MQKANTANAFSLDGLALSTANLYSAVQPGGSLFGLLESNPADVETPYRAPSERYGTNTASGCGSAIGGVNVFGGGLPLCGLNDDGEVEIVGGISMSGDTSCTDHIVARRVRDALGLDMVPTGVSATAADNAIHDISGKNTGGFGHPECDPTAIEVAGELPVLYPTN